VIGGGGVKQRTGQDVVWITAVGTESSWGCPEPFCFPSSDEIKQIVLNNS